MRLFRGTRVALALAFFAGLYAPSLHAEPLLRSGIGLQNCGKLVSDLKPSAGLDHLPNALLFYWFQGYLSAANIYLLNEYTDYIDTGAIEADAIVSYVAKFCKANPDKRPVNAIDQYIKDADKIDVKESDAFDPWEH